MGARTTWRLAILGALVVAMFTLLFSRLWFLQVLASDELENIAQENKVRRVHSEPVRGRILARGGQVLVDNRFSLAVTVDRAAVEDDAQREMILRRLSRLLDIPARRMERRLRDVTVSPYKPAAVAFDVPRSVAVVLKERSDRFPGVAVDLRPVRDYPRGSRAAHLLGYVGEISTEQLDAPYFTQAKRAYAPGDMVGKSGIERAYDRRLRGREQVEQVVVDSLGRVVSAPEIVTEGEPGKDVVLSMDLRIQRATERALLSGIKAARRAYEAPAGGAVVLDPRDGEVLAMASFPTYDPARLADGISPKEMKALGMGTPGDPNDDALVNRPMQQAVPPGSTFKTVTAGAAMATGVATPTTTLGCPPSKRFGSVRFNNWTTRDMGSMGFPRSLEVSCDTFYYDLGWAMEQRWGAALGNGSERFQRYMRKTGFGSPTGVDLPGETAGRVPDLKWCKGMREATKGQLCRFGWLPGYTVNLSIGQGDLIVSPLQMAVSYAALVNGGRILEPRVARAVTVPDEGGREVLRRIRGSRRERLPLGPAERAVLRRGLEAAVSGPAGTARAAFAGFPLKRHPVAGKTGTAQIGSVDSGLNYAWFVSYAPAHRPRYVVAVYLERAGHGGESAAPVARQIYEAIFRVDRSERVRLVKDGSG